MIAQFDYNGYSWDQNSSTIQEMTGISLPTIRAQSVLKSQQNGAIATGYRYGARVFAIKGHVKAPNGSPASYLAKRQAFFHALSPTQVYGHTATFTLITGDVRTLRYVRVTDGPFDFKENEPSVNWNSYAVIFESTFPFFEGTEHDSVQAVTVIGGGRAIPASIPAALGGGSSSSPYSSYVNNGNAAAYPIYTITGPGTNFTITNRTNGQTCTINTTLGIDGSTGVADTITIDTYNHTVTLNGDENILADFDGDFVTFDGGAAGATSTLAFTVDSGNTGNTQLRVVYKDTYLGL